MQDRINNPLAKITDDYALWWDNSLSIIIIVKPYCKQRSINHNCNHFVHTFLARFFMTLCWLINPHLASAGKCNQNNRFCSHVFLMRLKFCAHPSQNIQNWLRCACRFPQATATVPDYLPDPTEAAGQTEVTSMYRLTTCSLEWLEPNDGCSLRFDFICQRMLQFHSAKQ